MTLSVSLMVVRELGLTIKWCFGSLRFVDIFSDITVKGAPQQFNQVDVYSLGHCKPFIQFSSVHNIIPQYGNFTWYNPPCCTFTGVFRTIVHYMSWLQSDFCFQTRRCFTIEDFDIQSTWLSHFFIQLNNFKVSRHRSCKQKAQICNTSPLCLTVNITCYLAEVLCLVFTKRGAVHYD